MGVERTVLAEGNKADFPKPGDNIEMHYRGCLYKEGAEHNMGSQ